MHSAKSFVLVMAAAVTMLVVAACGAQPTPATSGSQPSSGVREIKVEATDFKFTPGDQTFKAGEQIKVTMINKGALDHTWVLADSSGKELLPKLEVKVGQTGSTTFTVPSAPGAYTIICDIAGHKEAGMAAKATVQ